VASAEESIRAANPGVELDARRPGQVLIVPDAAVLTDETEPFGLAPFERLVERLTAIVSGETGETDADADGERAELARLLKSAAAQGAVREDKQLAADLRQVPDALAAEQRQRVADRKALRRAAKGWLADLDRQRETFG
jgi:hypothetical protein